MGNAVFIVWRESVEALLIISILWAWLKNQGMAQTGRWHLISGGISGLVLAGVLATAMTLVQSELAGQALEYFQAGMVLLAALLITHMVLWMLRHGRGMKQQLTQSATQAFDRSGGLGIAALVAIAVAREGAETAIFLYGLSFQSSSSLWLGAALGLVLAIATAWALSSGLRWFGYASFFRVTAVLLLLLANALLVSGIEQLIGLEAWPALIDPLWSSADWLEDSRGLGGILASFAGYRAHPALGLLLAVGAFWALALLWWRKQAEIARA